MITVDNMRQLQAVQNHEDGELALVSDLRRIYRYNQEEDEWQRYQSEGGLNLSLFDLNKTAIPQLPTLSKEEILAKKPLIANFVEEKHSKYFMLLSNSYKYYTLFIRDETAPESIEESMIECLQGEIKSIEETEDGSAIEIWAVIDGKVYEFYFFEYSQGVIICR